MTRVARNLSRFGLLDIKFSDDLTQLYNSVYHSSTTSGEINGNSFSHHRIVDRHRPDRVCLVPVPDVTYKDVVGKILKFDANPKSLRYVIKGVAKDEVYVICLSTGGIAGIFQNHSKLDKYYTVVADSVSEAVKNGLIK